MVLSFLFSAHVLSLNDFLDKLNNVLLFLVCMFCFKSLIEQMKQDKEQFILIDSYKGFHFILSILLEAWIVVILEATGEVTGREHRDFLRP